MIHLCLWAMYLNYTPCNASHIFPERKDLERSQTLLSNRKAGQCRKISKSNSHLRLEFPCKWHLLLSKYIASFLLEGRDDIVTYKVQAKSCLNKKAGAKGRRTTFPERNSLPWKCSVLDLKVEFGGQVMGERLSNFSKRPFFNQLENPVYKCNLNASYRHSSLTGHWSSRCSVGSLQISLIYN